MALPKPNKNEIESKINIFETEIKNLKEDIFSIRKNLSESIFSPKIEIRDFENARGGPLGKEGPKQTYCKRKNDSNSKEIKNNSKLKSFESKSKNRKRILSLQASSTETKNESHKDENIFELIFPKIGLLATGLSKISKEILVDKFNEEIGKLRREKVEEEEYHSTRTPLKKNISDLILKANEKEIEKDVMEVETPVSLYDLFSDEIKEEKRNLSEPNEEKRELIVEKKKKVKNKREIVNEEKENEKEIKVKKNKR